MLVGGVGTGQREIKGRKKWDNCNRIKYTLKNKVTEKEKQGLSQSKTLVCFKCKAELTDFFMEHHFYFKEQTTNYGYSD